MPTPVSSNSSVYDPSAQLSRADDGDSGAVCSTSSAGAAASQAPPATVTLEPVYVVGELGEHTQSLVEQYDQRKKAPDCSLEARSAKLACISAAAAVVTPPNVVGAVAAGIVCGSALRDLYDCEKR